MIKAYNVYKKKLLAVNIIYYIVVVDVFFVQIYWLIRIHMSLLCSQFFFFFFHHLHHNHHGRSRWRNKWPNYWVPVANLQASRPMVLRNLDSSTITRHNVTATLLRDHNYTAGMDFPGSILIQMDPTGNHHRLLVPRQKKKKIFITTVVIVVVCSHYHVNKIL